MTGSKKILIADDDPSVLGYLKHRIELEGYEAATAETGKEAVDLAVNDAWDAMLLDLGLPDMSGFEVLESIKKVNRSLPIIVVTGSHEEQEARRAFEMGAWDYITKPIDFDYLKNTLILICNSL